MPSKTREDVWQEARRWVGTPYHDRGRSRGQSCDCIGLIIGVGRALGFRVPDDRDLPEYTPHSADGSAEMFADQLMRRDDFGNVGTVIPGQVGLFWFAKRGLAQHFCIFSRMPSGRITMIHAYKHGRRTLECGFSDYWRDRFIAAYDYRDLAR